MADTNTTWSRMDNKHNTQACLSQRGCTLFRFGMSHCFGDGHQKRLHMDCLCRSPSRIGHNAAFYHQRNRIAAPHGGCLFPNLGVSTGYGLHLTPPLHSHDTDGSEHVPLLGTGFGMRNTLSLHVVVPLKAILRGACRMRLPLCQAGVVLGCLCLGLLLNCFVDCNLLAAVRQQTRAAQLFGLHPLPDLVVGGGPQVAEEVRVFC